MSIRKNRLSHFCRTNTRGKRSSNACIDDLRFVAALKAAGCDDERVTRIEKTAMDTLRSYEQPKVDPGNC